jgi:pimeloyl-ACP methyl ester carboxylesterase
VSTVADDEHYWTDPEGRALCYAAYGDPAGLPLFFFHGWPSSRLQGKVLDAEAKRLGLRIISPDRPGLGRSDYAGKRALSDWPLIVSGLADHLEIDRFRVLGYSGGGPYALSCAAWLPDRVEKVSVVCGAPPLAEFPDRTKMLWAYRSLLGVRNRAPWLLEGLVNLSRPFSKIPPNCPPMSWLMHSLPKEDRTAMESAGGYETYFNIFREAVRQGGRGVVADADVYLDPWEMDFSSIQVPVLFWHGAQDRNIPIHMAREISARIPKADGRWFENEGHYSLLLRHMPGILEELCHVKEGNGRPAR